MNNCILIVDDAVFIRNMTKNVLNNAGYTNIVEADTAASAKEKFLANDPDLVILDVTLPDCEDLCLCQEFFRLKKDVKIIIYSAVTQDLVIKDAVKMGVVDYFTKPMIPEAFIKRVDSILK